MRWFRSVVVAVTLLVAPACATPPPPVAPLGHVSAAHAIRVRFRPRPTAIAPDFRGHLYPRADVERLIAENLDAIERFNAALVDTLQRAGYEVTENGSYDAHIDRVLYFDAEARQPRHGYFSLNDIVRVVFRVSDTNGREIERFDLHATEGLASATAPERIAVDLVNAMIQSPKVQSYSQALDRRSLEEPIGDTSRQTSAP